MGKRNTRGSRIVEYLKSNLDAKLSNHVLPGEIARTFDRVLWEAFEKENFVPIFVGQYILDPKDPMTLRVIQGPGTEACTGFPVRVGILGRAFRTGRDQYIQDVSKDRDHLICDPVTEAAHAIEIVSLSWSDPVRFGDYSGVSFPKGALDIDLIDNEAIVGYENNEKGKKSPIVDPKKVYKFDEREVKGIITPWKQYGKLILPGEPDFYIRPDMEKTFEFLNGMRTKGYSPQSQPINFSVPLEREAA